MFWLAVAVHVSGFFLGAGECDQDDEKNVPYELRHQPRRKQKHCRRGMRRRGEEDEERMTTINAEWRLGWREFGWMDGFMDGR